MLFQFEDTIDYTHINILDIYSEQTDFRRMGSAALVCEWNIALKNLPLNNSTESPENLGNINCFPVDIFSYRQCTSFKRSGDLRTKLFCGKASYPWKNNTWVITLKTSYIDIIV